MASKFWGGSDSSASSESDYDSDDSSSISSSSYSSSDESDHGPSKYLQDEAHRAQKMSAVSYAALRKNSMSL